MFAEITMNFHDDTIHSVSDIINLRIHISQLRTQPDVHIYYISGCIFCILWCHQWRPLVLNQMILYYMENSECIRIIDSQSHLHDVFYNNYILVHCVITLYLVYSIYFRTCILCLRIFQFYLYPEPYPSFIFFSLSSFKYDVKFFLPEIILFAKIFLQLRIRN